MLPVGFSLTFVLPYWYRLGDYVVMGGKSAVADHVSICSMVRLYINDSCTAYFVLRFPGPDTFVHLLTGSSCSEDWSYQGHYCYR